MSAAWVCHRRNRATHQPDRDYSKKHLEPRTSPEDSRPMLKRKTPLRAKSGFKKRGGKLKPFSEKGRKKNEEYKKVRKEYLEEKEYRCEICGGQATDIHHKSGRAHNTLEKRTFMALCRFCHSRCHDNPKWARENGYLVYEYKRHAD